jgi:hypothetical protein
MWIDIAEVAELTEGKGAHPSFDREPHHLSPE